MEQDLFFLMNNIMKKLTLVANRKLFVYGITYTEMRLLNVIYFSGTHSCDQNTFIEKIGIDRSNVGRGLKRLERFGYVKRERSEEDKRAYLVKLTKRGLEIKDELLSIRSEIQDTFLKDVDRDSYESMMDLMVSINDNLEEDEFFPLKS